MSGAHIHSVSSRVCRNELACIESQLDCTTLSLALASPRHFATSFRTETYLLLGLLVELLVKRLRDVAPVLPLLWYIAPLHITTSQVCASRSALRPQTGSHVEYARTMKRNWTRVLDSAEYQKDPR